jgi:gas vesicle protein
MFSNQTLLGRLALVLAAVVFLTACRSTYYAAWEKLGKHKRDLLRDNVEKARDEQETAKEEFKDALTRLKELTKFEGGKLEVAYRQVESEYEGLNDRAASIRDRIGKIEDVAEALFDEWEKELESYSSESLRTTSRQRLKDTQRRYEGLHAALQSSADSMTPILSRLKDQTLFLKHNLNAQAIGSIQGEVVSIEQDVRRLIEEMNASIQRADEFIRGLE